ncbi:MAG: DEAD/DEAH box helicase [Bacteroidia bacterium]|nr:DEAD/DEAH box helicase [Bacteroidia bacterium]
MSLLSLHRELRERYGEFLRAFLRAGAPDIRTWAEREIFSKEVYWSEPFYQVSPSYLEGPLLPELVSEGALHPEAEKFFRRPTGEPFRLHWHQKEAFELYKAGKSFVLTSGTGSGKSLAYFLPIVDALLREPEASWGVQALLVYPMNALANSQLHALESWAKRYTERENERFPLRFARYTGETQNREELRENPPHILLTNYMMLELLLVRPHDWKKLFQPGGLRFIVLDELHTYRGRRGADVAMLIRRLRHRFGSKRLLTIGTSATLVAKAELGPVERSQLIANFASRFFGEPFTPDQIIEERLQPRLGDTPPSAEKLRAGLQEAFSPAHPLLSWIEHQVGLRRESTNGREVFRRGTPRRLSELSQLLQEEIGNQELEFLKGWIEKALVYAAQERLLSFRIHQFIQQVGALLATLASPGQRRFALETQRPREENGSPWWRLRFCRRCGQEYYEARRQGNRFYPTHTTEEGEGETGFLALTTGEALMEKLSEEELERYAVEVLRVRPDGEITHGAEGIAASWQKGLKVCVGCGHIWHYRERGTFKKMASFSSEGRSSSTTALALTLLHRARDFGVAEKLLSFTDNRQDASLQAGHFNDFIQVAFIRAALYRALQEASPQQLRHTEAAIHIIELLKRENLLIPTFAKESTLDPESPSAKRIETMVQLLLEVLLLEDLWQAWRVLYPNLRQLQLVTVEFEGIETVYDNPRFPAWGQSLSLAERKALIIEVLQRFVDKRAIAVSLLLDQTLCNSLRNEIPTHLQERWADWIAEELHSLPGFSFSPRRGSPSLGARSALARLLRKKLQIESTGEGEKILQSLIEYLVQQGFLHREGTGERTLYRIQPSRVIWKEGNRRPVGFFETLYTLPLGTLLRLEAREHTAQVVRKGLREEREARFRGERLPSLPYLVCSPTMELGIDIAELDVVHLRNVPPSPPNYAQRSGRAGRQGQPGLILTFCNAYSPYERYFFYHQEEMITGSVRMPQMDLSQTALRRAHLHAFWLAQVGLDLGTSLETLIDIQAFPELPIRPTIWDQLREETEKQLSHWGQEALRLWEDLPPSERPTPEVIRSILQNAPNSLHMALERWRYLFRSVRTELEKINDAILAGKSIDALQRELQLLLRNRDILLNAIPRFQEDSDFYPYRYLATEGFLPGYNFPTLPVRAYLPSQEGEYLSRARPIALTEYAPGKYIYHEGSTWEIERLFVPPGGIQPQRYKLCDSCGGFEEETADVCMLCGTALAPSESLVELVAVRAKRRERIQSDEEERRRERFYDAVHYRYPPQEKVRAIEIETDEGSYRFTYAPSATVLLINRGKEGRGFPIDLQTGNASPSEGQGSARSYPLMVQGTHNILVIRPPLPWSEVQAYSLATAILQVLLRRYQVEEGELFFHIVGEKRHLLFYESTEGGAGVLQAFLQEEGARSEIAQQALSLCHFSLEGEDKAPDCRKACYDCLLSYSTSFWEDRLDRYMIRDILLQLGQGKEKRLYEEGEEKDRLQRLLSLTDSRSELERRFLCFLYEQGLRLPDEAQKKIELGDRYTVVDFFFSPNICVYCDGAPHFSVEQQANDQELRSLLLEKGYRVWTWQGEDLFTWLQGKEEVVGSFSSQSAPSDICKGGSK